MKRLEVLFSPAEFEALEQRDLSRTTCVVFDVLRATSSMITALANGAARIMPVETIEEALEFKRKEPKLLLAGEREGRLITRALTGSIDFDLGNSPREFSPERIEGKSLVMTTTNGTRALKACRGAAEILPASFLNLETVAEHLRTRAPEHLLLICSGTHEEAAYEDTLGAGALADLVWSVFENGHVADSAQIARNIYAATKDRLEDGMRFARNARRLLSIPELQEDVGFCLQRNVFPILARMHPDGWITRG